MHAYTPTWGYEPIVSMRAHLAMQPAMRTSEVDGLIILELESPLYTD